MYDLKIEVAKVLGECSADPPMTPGQYFTVSNGDIRIPQGSYICAWALHSLLPVITPKERKILESKEDDWMWRVHHAQCPDPDGRVIFNMQQMDAAVRETHSPAEIAAPDQLDSKEDGYWTLKVVVHEVGGTCTSGMKPGDFFILRSGRLYIPADRHFCLYALQATFPFLAAKQRHLEDGDWLKRANWIMCPDPAGNVIMKVDRLGTDPGPT